MVVINKYTSEISWDLDYTKSKKKKLRANFPKMKAAVSMATDVGTHIFTHFFKLF